MSCGASTTDPPSQPSGDTTPPTVTSVTPANAASGVALNTTIAATFSEAITSASATGASFTLVSDQGTSVAGAVSASGNTATFAPSASLAGNTRYTATISPSMRDSAGNALAAEYSWSFSTGAVPDVIAPTVAGTSPQNGASGVAFNTIVSVTFTEAMTNSTITPTSFIVAANGVTAVPGAVNVIGTTAIFTPTADFAPSTLYTVTITTAAKDASGNALASNFVLTFTTGVTPDLTAPTVTATTPANGATGVARSTTVSATFSETMSDATITTASFTLTPSNGGSAVAGTISVAGALATFTPALPLAGTTQYTATLSTAVTDASGNPLAGSVAWTFTTAAAPDVTAPTIIASTPGNGATGVALNTSASVTFSEPMTNATLTTSSFTLVPTAGGAAVAGTVSVAGNTATFTPSVGLAGNTQYTATVTTAAKDAAGNALAANTSWSFTTGAAPDLTPPTVASTTPTSGATGVSRSAPVTATFSEPMTNATLTTTSVTVAPTVGGAAVAGTVTVTGNTVSFTPTGAFAGSTQFTATITTAAKDAAGNALAANYTWTFTTSAAPDVTPPTIIASTPTNGATAVTLNTAPTVTFSEPMQNATLTTSTFTLVATAGGAVVAGTVTVTGNTATFTPGTSLAGNTQYTATVTTGAKDAAGNALAAAASWSFATGAAPDVTPPTITAFTPGSGATGVPVNATATVTFSEPMQNATITTTSFSLRRTTGGVAVAGSVTVAGNTATFTPGAALTASTQYTATVTTAVTDAAGNALAANTSWSFTTAAPADVTPPTIAGSTPANGATGVVTGTTPTVTFSEPMQNATITTTTFSLAPTAGGAAVAGVVSISGNTATFTPTAALATSTQYTATVTTGVRDVAGNALAANASWSFTTAAPADVTPPTIVGNTPANGATGVATGTAPSVTFSEPMQNATITTTTFSLRPSAGGGAVAGVTTVSGNTATFTPGAALAPGTQYTATVTSGVRDVAGNALAANHSWTFVTVAAPDLTPPTVTSTSPANGSTGVSVTTVVTATFSEPMQNATITTTTFSLVPTAGGAVVSGIVSVNGNVATFTANSALAASTQYTATVTTGVRDVAGNALAANASWSFTTAAPADVTPPTVTSTSPAGGATGVSTASTVRATFSEPMQNATLTTASFTLTRVIGLAPVSGTVTVSGNTATFTPISALMAGRQYTAVITTAAKDAAGNSLASTYTWSFTTAP